LIISTIQADLIWEDKSQNFQLFEKLFSEVSNDSKLIVLPEMFTTGFSMNPTAFAEMMDGESVTWMKQQAAHLNKFITGSLIIKEDNLFYNRLIVADPNGEVTYYDKKHLFRYANEHENYAPGLEHLIVKIGDFNIAFFVCYDLRFPVWSRNIKLQYHAAIYIANWPKKRRDHWSTLLKARAIENQAYVIGVNRIGEDGNGVEYSGDSTVFNPLGEKISTTEANIATVENIRLNLDLVNEYRIKFPAHLDADDFQL
jgi:omega-amidase